MNHSSMLPKTSGGAAAMAVKGLPSGEKLCGAKGRSLAWSVVTLKRVSSSAREGGAGRERSKRQQVEAAWRLQRWPPRLTGDGIEVKGRVLGDGAAEEGVAPGDSHARVLLARVVAEWRGCWCWSGEVVVRVRGSAGVSVCPSM